MALVSCRDRLMATLLEELLMEAFLLVCFAAADGLIAVRRLDQQRQSSRLQTQLNSPLGLLPAGKAISDRQSVIKFSGRIKSLTI